LYRTINGIHYFSINSASYQFHRDPLPGRYPEEVYQNYPWPSWLDHISMYKDTLYCFVAIDPSGKLSVRGVKSEWDVTPPANEASKSIRFGRESLPVISDHDISLL